MRSQEARSALRSLPDVESHVEAVPRAYGPLTQAQLAAKVFGVPVKAIGDRDEDRKRDTAIRSVQRGIVALRRRDVPVIDTPAGMTIATTADECATEFRRLRARVRSQVVTAWGLRRAERVLRAIEEGRLVEPEPVALTLGLDTAA